MPPPPHMPSARRWAYIRDNKLADPANKGFYALDDNMKAVRGGVGWGGVGFYALDDNMKAVRDGWGGVGWGGVGWGGVGWGGVGWGTA
jgi:hypothetical protein